MYTSAAHLVLRQSLCRRQQPDFRAELTRSDDARPASANPRHSTDVATAAGLVEIARMDSGTSAARESVLRAVHEKIGSSAEFMGGFRTFRRV
jgi:hypothetical protein